MNIELFPCSGGMAEGFRRAGITFDLAIDKDEDACDSYAHNHGHRPLQMDVNDFAQLVRSGWRPSGPRTLHVNGTDHSWPIEGGIDLFVADPPCTPWSRAGDRLGLDDERDCLRVTAELIALLRPRAYLIGNVPGLQDATQWKIVQDVIGGLSKHGYCVRDYAQLDAADYGVPQNRVRPFWFGHLDGPCLRWPEQTHAAPAQAATVAIPGTRQLLPWVTCRQALSHLSLEELGRPVRMRLRKKGEDGTRTGGDDTRCSEPEKPAKTVVAKQHRKGDQILIPGVQVEEMRRKSYVPNGGDASVCSKPDVPARVVVAHEGIKGGGILLTGNEAHAPSTLDAPAKTVTGGRANRGVQGGRALVIDDDRHPMARADGVAPTIRSGGDGHSAPQVVLAVDEVVEHPRHPVSRVDEPAFVVKTNGGRASGAGSILKVGDLERDPARRAHSTSPDEPAKTITGNTHSEGATLVFDERALGDGQGSRVGSADEPSSTVDAAGRGQHGLLEWPWDRPATTVTSRDSLGAPGHHDPAIRGYSGQYGPNAVVLSEKAAAILQGFPDGWLFSGETKAARWAQIGMAMPPGLADPVARAIVDQQAAARGDAGAAQGVGSTPCPSTPRTPATRRSTPPASRRSKSSA